MERCRIIQTIEYELSAIKLAEETSIDKAAKSTGKDRNQICEWIKNKERFIFYVHKR